MMKFLISVILFTFTICKTINAQVIPGTGITDPVVLEHFFDGLMNDHLLSKHVAGAVVAVVKDGNIMFTKGYGYSDYAAKKLVSTDSTLFRIGSISKTFTWTAVMQLAEKGKLNLDEDVNVYLKDFKIPDGEGGPVTLRHLMTHTPGFEDHIISLFADNEKALRPYGEILKEQLPERVRPAGVEMSYSNHGAGIAAYIVEQVSGLQWNEYVERNILHPLGMNNTSFRQPLPSHLTGMLSKGYNYENGAMKEYEFELIPVSAVGGASATATDMAKYMITHLQMGRYKDVRILDSVSSSMMQALQFRVSPYVSGTGLGFYELTNWNGLRTIGHGGDTFWFHSLMALIPEINLGFFVSFNTQTADYSQVFKVFLSHFYPLSPPKEKLRLNREMSDKFKGEFRFNRYPHTDLTRISSIMSIFKVEYDNNGCLLTKERDAKKWFPVNDSTFIEETGDEYLVFGRLVGGKYTRAFLGNLAVMPLERVPLIDSPGLHMLVLTLYMAIFIFTIVFWPVAYLIKRNYTLNAGEPVSLPAVNKWTGWLASILVLVFFTGFAGGLSKPWEIMYGVPYVIKIMLIIPLILCALLVVMIYQAYKLTLRKEFNFFGKIHFYALIISLVLLLWQLNHWNLLGFKY